MKINYKNIASITNGKANKEWEALGVSIDTRSINSDNLFVALKGDKFNGHSFIKEAINKGAAAIVINEEELKEEYLEYPLLIVKDTYKALIEIAREARKQFKGKVIAVTGSVGKTTTKEMLKNALGSVTSVYANKGNYNNSIGMPLSLANLNNDYNIAILELGMSEPKEIEELSNILQPHIAIITEVSNSHSIGFKSMEDIFLAKMEIIAGLVNPKILIFNGGNYFFNKAEKISKENKCNFYSFGVSSNKEALCLNNIKNQNSNNADNVDFSMVKNNVITSNSKNGLNILQEITAKIVTYKYKYTLKSLAKHKGLLSVLSLGVAYLLKLDIEKVANSFVNYNEVSGRGEIINIKVNHPNSIKFFLIDDSYNASSLSMQKSILALKNIKTNNRKILVLGDMLSLKNEVEEHMKLKEYIVEINAAAVLTLGSRMKHLNKILPESVYNKNFSNIDKLKQKLINFLENNDIVLAKGSFNSNIYKIVNELKKLNTNDN